MDTTKLPKTRKEAQETGATHYFTGAPCKHGHVAPRKTKGACIECLKIEWQKSAVTRAGYFKAYNQSEAGLTAKQEYYKRNRDAVIARAQARPAEEKRAYRKVWKEHNELQVLADNKVRRRKHQQATPPWLDKKQKMQVRQLYQIAITMTQTTGEHYVVDHIYPLRSDIVCGLHVPWNLRVITQAENLRKSNTLPDDAEALAFHKPT
jgi:5-methylcytosine-specific restriction endonuclease McrA